MLKGRRRWIALGALAATLAVAAGAGVAATGGGDDGFLADVARRLGITEQKLTDAIRDARLAQVDEAVQAGDLTEEQGERLKERIRSGEGRALGPAFGRRGLHFHGPFGGPGRGAGILEAAAEFLDVTAAELRESLADEQTLAEVARAKGKSVEGLKTAIRTAIEADLDEAVDDGRLTQAQADRMAENLAEHVDRIVDEGFRVRRFHRHFGPGPGEEPDASFVPGPAPALGTF